MTEIIATDLTQFTKKRTPNFFKAKMEYADRLIRSNINLFTLIDKLNKVVDTFIDKSFTGAVCTKGCSHCCNIAVGLTNIEAAYIESRTGHVMSRQKDLPKIDTSTRTPCPMLKNNECSIYEHRPIACRVFMTFDSPEICADESMPSHWVVALRPMGEGGHEGINYLYTQFIAKCHAANSEAFQISDIREFFKSETT